MLSFVSQFKQIFKRKNDFFLTVIFAIYTQIGIKDILKTVVQPPLVLFCGCIY
jgi:hypothetical protein